MYVQQMRLYERETQKVGLSGNPPKKPMELKVEFSHNDCKEILHENSKIQRQPNHGDIKASRGW